MVGAVRARIARIAAVAALALGQGCTCGSAAPPPPPAPPAKVATGVALERVASGLDEPVAVVAAPGDPPGRLYVVEKPGRIRVLEGGEGGRAADPPVLDVSALVSTGSEQGLLGLAFHPRYAENGRFFVNYTDRQGHTHVVEYRAQPGAPTRADPASAHELLRVAQPYANHNGGHLVFGPDGKLYVGTGDGGSRDDPQQNGQNRAALLGKMLTLDVDADRPAPEIIQIGLRNPWRYSFDRQTGDLYIADVGQDRFEEVHVLPAGQIAGQNLGWNVVEGDGHCLRGDTCAQEGMQRPVIEYTHSEGCSITGGFVYRGRDLPELSGVYFYADYCTSLLRSFRYRDGRATEPTDWRPILDPDGDLSRVTSFGEDTQGELYIASQDGAIFKLVRRR